VIFLRRWVLMVGTLALPMAVLLVLRAMPGIDAQWFSPAGHLFLVGAIASCATMVAIAAIATAVRSRQAGVVLLGLGCSAVGVLMLGHGLTTPGAIGQPGNLWVGRLPYLAMAIFSVSLFLAGTRGDRPMMRWVGRHPLPMVLAPLGALAALVVRVVIDPRSLHGGAPLAHENTIDAGISTAVVVLMVLVVWRHSRRWQLGRDVVQLAIVLAAGTSIAAVVAFEHGRFARLSWWDYHAYLLAGFGSTVYAVVVRGRRQQAISSVLDTTFVDDPFDHIVHGYPEALSTLVKALEVKDVYTHGHSLRTAELAIELGLVLQLPPDRLRVIARGAYLHDLGKIAIPDHILNKPTALTAEERAVIESHPQLGYELASSAPSLREVLPVILHHHERMDGAGYPGGLAGSAVPLEARVVAVADVWDALTSDRAYRPRWSSARALAHIQAGAGTHFDPVVVRALAQYAADRGVLVDRSVGDADTAWEAAQTCHEIDSPPQAA